MPIDPMVVDQFLGHPDPPDSTAVRVSGEIRRGFGRFDGKVIVSVVWWTTPIPRTFRTM
jgi:hypothetical protein